MEVTRGERLHIGIFGATNAGKSTLLNFLVGTDLSIVSEIKGTTTDCVYKNMEVPEVGPVTFIDTAGFEDDTALADKRLTKTWDALKKSDIIICILNDKDDENSIWLKKLLKSKKPFIKLYRSDFSNTDFSNPTEVQKKQKKKIFDEIRLKIPEDFGEKSLTGNLCEKGDNVVLVMPQDIAAPKGRLILPQVQVMRELLDKKCIVHACTQDEFKATLQSLAEDPCLIITDSQVFAQVYKEKSEKSKLTSFSILMANHKGDIALFLEGAKAIDSLCSSSRVLIAEACAHSPKEEDIGRVKIPAMLKKKFPGIKIDFVRGTDFLPAETEPKEKVTLTSERGSSESSAETEPKEKVTPTETATAPEETTNTTENKPYDLVIHCGACMFNRCYVLSRQQECLEKKIPMTNYGIFLAKFTGILDKVEIPNQPH